MVLSFLIGERSNFIKLFLILNIFMLFLYKPKIKVILANIFLVFSVIIITFSVNAEYKSRYINQIFHYPNGIKGFFENSQHGAQYNVAIEIFKDNPFFGVGIKNFRKESALEKYEDLDHNLNAFRSTTHPHQLHFEFLAETGLFGYFSFLIFIILSLIISLKTFFKNKNFYQLSSILFIFASLLPLLPSGSFLSSYFSSIFWFNYALMMSYNKT